MKKRVFNKWVPGIFVAAVFISCFMIGAPVVKAETIVSDEPGFINALNSTEPVITIANDITLTQEYQLTRDLTIKSVGGATLTWGGAAYRTMFTLNNNSNFTIEDVTLDGNGVYATLVKVEGGTFIMDNGAVLKNVLSNGSNRAVTIGNANDPSMGGTFNMNGGLITDVSLDGAVMCYNGTINMGGNAAISNNSAYGIGMIDSILNMTGNAAISGNTASRTGVGVLAGNGSVINMGLHAGDAPRIANNTSTAYYGGGAYLVDSELHMGFGASISYNNAETLGGGLALNRSALTMNGSARISGNTTRSGVGGGILASASTVGLSGNASVFENSVTAVDGRGGGIYLQNASCRLTISDSAAVYGNESAFGAGIYLNNDTELQMSGGSINNNIATTDGGGVYSRGSLAISGGTINGNGAGTRGKNILMSYGTFNILGSPQIGSRTDSGGVFLWATRTINMTGRLTRGARINLEEVIGSVGSAQLGNIVATAATASDLPYFYYTPGDFGLSMDGSNIVLAAPTYGITLTPFADKIFPASVKGYNAQAPHSITVSSSGTRKAGALTVSLGGANPGAFELSKTALDLAEDTDDGFTVVLKTGLDVGTHTATVTVSGSHGISQSFNVSFTVNALPELADASIAPTSASFDKYAPADVSAMLTPGSYTLNKITFGGTDLAPGYYSESGGVYTFKKAWLAGLSNGSHTITFDMSGGSDPTLALTVSDSTPAQYTIKASPNSTKYGSVKGGGTYKAGESCTLTATPKQGYYFKQWTENGKRVASGYQYKFTATKARTLKAEFAKVGSPALKAARGYNQIKLSWKAVGGANRYEIYRKAPGEKAYKKIAAVANPTYTNKGLKFNKSYAYKVRAVCKAGQAATYGEYSNICKVKTLTATPLKVVAKKSGGRALIISWERIPGAQGYQVYRMSKYSGGYAQIRFTRTNAFGNTQLVSGRTYYYKVRSWRMDGGERIYGVFSKVFKVTVR